MAQSRQRAEAGRIAAIDLARGVALVAMAAYHLLWDLSFYGLIGIGIGISPVWIGTQRAILTAFLLLAGASLALAHGDGMRWRAFWRRWLMLAAAALAVSLGTYWLLPDYFAYFGVLHAIALFSLLALPLVRAPLPLVLGVSAIVLVTAFYSSPLFNIRALSWLGFFTQTPETTDLVPVSPWFGVLLLGVAGLRVVRHSEGFARLSKWQSTAKPARLLQLLGRWSLVFYLLHQPLLLGVIYPLSQWRMNDVSLRATEFTLACTASCAATGETEKYCIAYCQCALDVTSRDDLWAAISADPRTPEQQQSVAQMSKLCTAMAEVRQ